MSHLLTESQAYPELPDYGVRAAQKFAPGDPVRVGPGYRAFTGGRYEPDGLEGPWFVIRQCNDGDCWISRQWDDDSGQYAIHASRLVPR